MNRLIIIFLAFSLVLSCQFQDNKRKMDKYLDNSIKVDSLNIPLNSNQEYFPYEIFTDTTAFIGSDTSSVNWYSIYLRLMKEPLLFNKKQDKEIYRFLWLRTFHNPVSIRIEKQNDNYSVTWKLCDGAGGYDPGKMTINKTKSIDKATWKRFKSLLKEADYWYLNTNEIDKLGLDGSQWILEGTDNERYHVVDRWTPKNGSFYDCCDLLIGLTDLKINKDDKY